MAIMRPGLVGWTCLKARVGVVDGTFFLRCFVACCSGYKLSNKMASVERRWGFTLMTVLPKQRIVAAGVAVTMVV